MKKLLYTLFLALCPLLLVAQAPDALWTKTYGGRALDRGFSVQQTSDGDYIIAGSTASFGNGSSDVYLIKTDSLGDTLWTRTYGDSAQDRGWSVQQTTDGGYIVAGWTESFGAGLQDVYLIKIAPETGIEEERILKSGIGQKIPGPTIFCGLLLLPQDKTCRVLDITGRVVMPDKIKPGIYFIEVDGKVTKKVVKIR